MIEAPKAVIEYLTWKRDNYRKQALEVNIRYRGMNQYDEDSLNAKVEAMDELLQELKQSKAN